MAKNKKKNILLRNVKVISKGNKSNTIIIIDIIILDIVILFALFIIISPIVVASILYHT